MMEINIYLKGLIFILIPVLPLILLVKSLIKADTLEKKHNIDSKVLLSDFNIFKIVSVNSNNILYNKLLAQNIEREAIKKYLYSIKYVQLSGYFYMLFGIIQLLLILRLGISTFSNAEKLFMDDPHILSGNLGILFSSIISFWIFFGKQIAETVGLYKFSELVTKLITLLFVRTSMFYQKLWSLGIVVINLVITLFFLKTMFIEQIDLISIFVNPLIYLLVLIFFHYYIINNILGFLFYKIRKKNIPSKDKHFYILLLKNNSYLTYIIIYIMGMILNRSDSLLLQAITVLFLVDTYMDNRLKN